MCGASTWKDGGRNKRGGVVRKWGRRDN